MTANHASSDTSHPLAYQPWLDWLKVGGMAVILFGHTGGDSLIPPIFNPINPKQLGVALFVFVTAFTLAKEMRSGWRIVYNRFFEMAYVGLCLSGLLSLVGWMRQGDIYASNYLPYFLGINVVWENAFPANPSTWYVGTYLHLLILWGCLLRWLPKSWPILFVLVPIEIGVRAAWMSFNRDFNAYMIVTSWLTVFTIGLNLGHTFSSEQATIEPDKRLPFASRRWVAAAIGLLMLTGWLWLGQSLGITKSNPFGRIPMEDGLRSAIVTSASVTLQYVIYTLVAITLVQGVSASGFIRLLSRNTLWVFLAHMPVRDWVTPLYYPWFPNGWLRQLANFVVLFVGLALVSEALRRALRINAARKWLASRLFTITE